tara:strand:+ start:226 stop:1038 length:813 start_codon:yes stop_codon:yes gene_type:complete
MKSFNQFVVESYTARENIHEALPLLIPAAMKLGSMALGAYSAYSAAKNLKKGNYKGAALDALGMIPGGVAFKGAKALGAGKHLARAASTTQSVVRNFSPNARNRAISKGIDVAAGALGVGGAANQTAKKTGELNLPKDTAPAAPKNNTVADVKSADKSAGKSNLGGGQTDGMITAVAGRGAVASGKGNTGYYSGGGSTGGKKTGTGTKAPKSTENTAVGTTAKRASDEKNKQVPTGNTVKTTMNPDSSLKVTQKRDPRKTAKIKQALELS